VVLYITVQHCYLHEIKSIMLQHKSIVEASVTRLCLGSSLFGKTVTTEAVFWICGTDSYHNQANENLLLPISYAGIALMGTVAKKKSPLLTGANCHSVQIARRRSSLAFKHSLHVIFAVAFKNVSLIRLDVIP
jgi:hypothetical protein